MKVLLSWLKEFAPFSDDVETLARAMNSLGLEVDGITRFEPRVEGVVVAKVLRRAPHPKADRIGLVWVDIGDGEELQICCGAFNMEAGDLVALATVGTTMPDGREIGRAKMRGEWSNGMLCSTDELELGDGPPKSIWILPGDLPLGVPIYDAMAIDSEVVFELSLTRNRPDCWGHLGVARDLAAHLGLAFSPPDVSEITVAGPSTGLTVQIDDPRGCGRFTARRISGVSVGPSPDWLANRLARAGMRSINNVVDVSNAVMLELNRPNHAYDEAKLGGGGFLIRSAAEGEQIVTLDDLTRTLRDTDNLICDATGTPIGIGGIMGGQNTEVDDTTTTVALEQAWFDPDRIVATCTHLDLRSEASARFERGCDPYDDDYAARRFVQLLRHTCPDAQLHDIVEATGELPPFDLVVVRVPRVNAVLGLELDAPTISALIAPIGYTTIDTTGQSVTVQIPTWRYDSTSEIDVIEEIARHYGYARIIPTVPDSPHAGQLSARQRDRRAIRDVLVGAGCSEVMPLPFLAPGDLDRAGLPGDGLVVTNPLAAEESILRTSLLPGILRTVAYNASHRRPGISVFEVGHAWRRGDDPAAELPDEREHVVAALAGREAPAAVALLDEITAALGFGTADLVAATAPGLHPTRTARVQLGGAAVGWTGEVDPDVLAAHGISERVAWLELDLDDLLAQPHGLRTYRRVSRMPSSDIDLAFVVPDGVAASAVESTITSAAGELLVSLALFDVYRGTHVPDGSRSLAYNLRLQAADRTLTDADVAAVRAAVIDAVSAAHGATLR